MSILLMIFGAVFAQERVELRRGEEKIDVVRDAWGIPHIFAPSVESAFWAEGYTEAQDRFNQMDRVRRAAKGELAEVAGKKALGNDIDRRKRGYREAELQEMFESGGERFRGILRAYAEGVNAWRAESKKEARPWSVTDSVAVAVMMARRFGEAGDEELTIQEFFQTAAKSAGEEKAREMLEDVIRLQDDSAPTTLGDHRRVRASGKEQGFLPPVRMDEGWLVRHAGEMADLRQVRASLGIPVYFGSNAWAVMPKKSKSGNAMLYGGPMMGFDSPSICNEIHLNAPGLNAAGMSFPGAPGVLIGFNETMAWTTTSGSSDLVDIYELELDPENPGRYRHQGEWKEFEKVEEEVKVAGEASQKVVVYRSVYGPLVEDPDPKTNRAYAMAMSFWKREAETFEGAVEIEFARNVEEARGAVRKIVTSHNYFAADREGHIGFWYCGRHPRRAKGHDPRFPQKGDGSMDWTGFLPFEEWPQGIDPASGFFGNWNNKPTRDWFFLPHGKIFWGKRIFDELERSGKIDREKVWSLSRETAYHAFQADYFLPYILPHVQDPELRKELTEWDHLSREGEVGTELVSNWVQKMIPRVFGKDLGVIALDRRSHRYLVDPLLYLLEGESSVVRLRHEWGKGRDLQNDAAVILEAVLKGGREKLAYHEPTIDFRGKQRAIPSEDGRGTFQMAVELTKEGPIARTLAAPGQSEASDSPHFADQLDLFREWKGKSLELMKKP